MPGRQLMPHTSVGRLLTLEALAGTADVHPSLVASYVDYGLLDPVNVEETGIWFDVRATRRLRTICRLREDLGINLPGIAAVLDLLARCEALQRELASLHRR